MCMRRENVLGVSQNRTIDYVKKSGWMCFHTTSIINYLINYNYYVLIMKRKVVGMCFHTTSDLIALDTSYPMFYSSISNAGVKHWVWGNLKNKSFCLSHSPPPESLHMRLKLKMHQSHNNNKSYYLRNNTWILLRTMHSTHIYSEHLEREWENHSARVLSWWKEFSGQLLAEFQQHILSGYCMHEGFQYHLCSTHTGLQSGCLVVVAQCS